jgi:hypothetical protein
MKKSKVPAASLSTSSRHLPRVVMPVPVAVQGLMVVSDMSVLDAMVAKSAAQVSLTLVRFALALAASDRPG